jgi:hypothetical protein
MADLGLDDDLTVDVPSDMPDWLAANDDEAVPDWLSEEIEDSNEQPAIPDWLQETATEAEDIAQVFVDDNSDMDVQDSWVEAFELERKMEMEGLNEIPEEWFEADITGEIEEEIVASTLGLEAANLPSDEALPAGEPEGVPDWLGETAPPAAIDTQEELAAADMPDWLMTELPAETAEVPEIPDWLSESAVDDDVDIPDWLIETVEDQAAVVVPQTIAPVTPTPKPQASPAPVPVSNIDVSAVLQDAKANLATGDLDTALQGYEAAVRANQHLDVIIQDLGKAANNESFKKNPGLYRVLGDAFMRQGKLQEALNTYRKALTLL